MIIADDENRLEKIEEKAQEQSAENSGNSGNPENPENAKPENQGQQEKDKSMFSHENIADDSKVPAEEVSMGAAISIGTKPKDVVITPADKEAFINSVVNNTRFEREYRLFGGKLNVTIRSITADEANALAAYAFKKSMSDPSWHLSGMGRRHILSAQVSMFNGTKIPPLAEPLFETLDKDGKVNEPGWVASTSFWAGKDTAVVDAILRCISDFDIRYSTLCNKAEDENFWTPDTP